MSIERRVFCLGKSCAYLNQANQLWDERMILVRAIESMVAVGPGGQQANGGKPTQFVLNSAESQPTHAGEFAHVALLLRQVKK